MVLSRLSVEAMIETFSEICEYIGSRLKVPTEINGFLQISIIASLYQNTKNRKSNFMMIFDL